MTTQYIIGLILILAAIAFHATQPILSAVIALTAVITLGRVLRKLL
jgi:hypothetical protein